MSYNLKHKHNQYQVSAEEQNDLRDMFICTVPPTPQTSANRARDRWKNMWVAVTYSQKVEVSKTSAVIDTIIDITLLQKISNGKYYSSQ